MANWKEHIIINPKICVGKPAITGTRLTVDFIIGLLAQGWAMERILKNYPQLRKDDIQAALEYSSYAIKLESVFAT